jgi:hypothetical protein
MRASVINKVKLNGVDISNTTLSSSGNSDSFKKSWIDQLMLFIEVGSKVGGGNITFVVQSSYNNVTWFDHTAGSAISAAGVQLLTETNVGPYIRIKWTLSAGTATGVKLTTHAKGGQ